MSARKKTKSDGFKEGDIMRVKETGVLVRLIKPENPHEDQALIDEDGCVYVEPIEEPDGWYYIDDLEKA